jgi:hypothetical protein
MCMKAGDQYRDDPSGREHLRTATKAPVCFALGDGSGHNAPAQSSGRSSSVRKVVDRPFRKGEFGNPQSRTVADFQIGDRVKLADPELEGVVIGKSYGEVRYEVRCDNGRYVRELLPNALSLIDEPPNT